MKIFKIFKRDQNQIDHLFVIQKARCYEYVIACRKIGRYLVSAAPEPYLTLNSKILSTVANTHNILFEAYPNLKKKWGRMISAKQQFEHVDGKYK